MNSRKHVVSEERWRIPDEDVELSSTNLGRGVFGQVQLGHWIGTEVAVKYLKKSARPEESNTLEKEVHIMSELCHPNIVQLLGYCNSRGRPSISIVMEYLPGGSLEDYMLENKNVAFDLRLRWCSDMAKALAYLHNTQNDFLVHRDVKPANFMLTLSLECKLGDFGLSRRFRQAQPSSTDTEPSGVPPTLPEDAPVESVQGGGDPGHWTEMEQTCNVGTARYMAPEVRDGPDSRMHPVTGKFTANYSAPADVFSLGMCYYFVMEGGTPPSVKGGDNPQRHFSSLAAGNRPVYKHTKPPVRRLVDLMLMQHAWQRPTCKEVGVILKSMEPPSSPFRRRGSGSSASNSGGGLVFPSIFGTSRVRRETTEAAQAAYAAIYQRASGEEGSLRFDRSTTW